MPNLPGMENYQFVSPDKTVINCYRWCPQGEPVGIIQIAHGMGEHAARYHDFALDLVNAGYLVFANDHRGHGLTARVLGDFGENGWQCMVDDLHALNREYAKQYADKPIMLFGHSMGSMLSEQYVTQYGDSIDTLVLSGSPGFTPNLMVWFSRLLCRFEAWRLGPLKESQILSFLIFGASNKAFDTAGCTGFEWLSRDNAEVKRYIDDPLCGFVPFPASLKTMFDGVKLMQDKASIGKIPKDLPVYMFSGDEDPVHGGLENIKRLTNAWEQAGLQIETEFYAGGRHDMLNETNKTAVIANTIAWIKNKLIKLN